VTSISDGLPVRCVSTSRDWDCNSGPGVSGGLVFVRGEIVVRSGEGRGTKQDSAEVLLARKVWLVRRVRPFRGGLVSRQLGGGIHVLRDPRISSQSGGALLSKENLRDVGESDSDVADCGCDGSGVTVSTEL